jgi:hypothetical protein
VRSPRSAAMIEVYRPSSSAVNCDRPEQQKTTEMD